MRIQDLLLIRGEAIKQFNGITTGSKLVGMVKPLDHGESVTLAYYQAVLAVLNRDGAITPGWIEAHPVVLLQEDSEPETED